MARTKRKADPDQADPDFQPLPASADNDNDNDDYVEKPAAKRGRRSTTGSTATARKSTTSRASKASKAAAHIPFEPHPVDDPIPEAPAPQLRNASHNSDMSPYGPAINPQFPWETPASVPEKATNWWDMIELETGNPASAALLLENVSFSSSTLLAFPDPAHLNPETAAFVGPAEFSFFQVPHLLREPLLQCKRPKLNPDGLQCTDYRANPTFISHSYSLPVDVDVRNPLLKRQFDGTGENFTLYSDVFNKHLRNDKHLNHFKDKNKNYPWFPGGSTPLAFLREVKFVPRAHFVRPATVPAVGNAAAVEPSSEHVLFDVDGADSIGLNVISSMEDYIAILVRPHSKERYTTHEQGADGQQERTSWRYIASVYLILDKLQALMQGPSKAQSQTDVHALLKLFSKTRPTNFSRPQHPPTDQSLASSTDFAERARRLEISPDLITTFSKKHLSGTCDGSGHVVQIGPNGPYYDPSLGLFASHYSALSGELTTHDRRRPQHVINMSRESGLTGRPICDNSTSNHQRMLNALHLIAAQPCTRPTPIPTAHLPRMPSRASLIATAGVCIAHWESLARQVLGPTASIVTLPSAASLTFTSLRDMLVADLVIMSDNLLLDPNAWTRRAVFPNDFNLSNVTPNKLQLPAAHQEYYYGGNEQHAAYIDFVRRDVPARRLEHMGIWRSSPDKDMVEATAQFFADVTVAYWHRIVIDRWTEVSSLHSLLAGRAWVTLESPERASDPAKAMAFGQGGVFMDLAHTLSVATDEGSVPQPAVKFATEQVHTGPMDLALGQISRATTSLAHPWDKMRTRVSGMRASDECRGYPYLSSSSFDMWPLKQVAEELDTLGQEFHKQQATQIAHVQLKIKQLHTTAKGLNALEITLAVLHHSLQRLALESTAWVRAFVQGVTKKAPAVTRNEHIDFTRYKLRVPVYERQENRPTAFGDKGEMLWPEVLRTLDSGVQVVLDAVRDLDTVRIGWDVCEGAMRLVNNTTSVEGWLATIVHRQQGAGGSKPEVICCPSCGKELADSSIMVVSSTTLDFAHCTNCLPSANEYDCKLLKYEFAPVPNIKQSRQWYAQLVAAEMRGAGVRIWARPLIQSLVLHAIRILSSDDADADADAEPKRIAMFLSADHVKAAGKCFTLFNVPCVKLDTKHAYKSLKALYSTQSTASRDAENADDSSIAASITQPEHIPIVLVDTACPRMARVRIPGVTHVFLGSKWRDVGPSSCVATALRPASEEQHGIEVVSFVGNPFCETVAADSSWVQLAPRKNE